MKKLSYFLMSMAISVSLFAQKPVLKVEEILDSGGNCIMGVEITKDKFGFLWFFPTLNNYEIYRYDGYETIKFEYNPSDSLSVQSKSFDSWFWGNSGTILFNTGRNIIDFSNYQNSYTSKYQKIINDTILFDKIVEDNKGNLWILYQKHLLFYDIKKDSILKHYNDYSPELYSFINDKNLSNIISNLIINDFENECDTSINFHIENKTTVLISSAGQSGNLNDELKSYATLIQDKDTIWKMQQKNCMWIGGDYDNLIENKIIELEKGNYTLNYKTSGFDKYIKPEKIDFLGCKIFNITNKNLDTSTIKNGINEEIYDILLTEKQELCLLTKTRIYISKDNINFKYYDFGNIDISWSFSFQNFGSNFIISNYKNDFLYNIKSEKLKILTSNYFHSKFDKKNNKIWSINKDSVFCFNINGDKEYLYNTKELLKTKENDYILSFFIDSQENLLISTYNKLLKIKISNFQSYYPPYITKWTAWINRIIYNNLLYFRDRNNISSNGHKEGLTIFNIKTKKVKRFNNSINQFIKYSDKQILGWDYESNTIYCFDETKELITDSVKTNNDTILSLYQDSKKQIWVFTSSKIYQLDTSTFSLTTVTKFIVPKSYYYYNNFIDYITEINNNLIIRTFQGVFLLETETNKIKKIVKFNEKYEKDYFFQGNVIFDKKNNKLWFSTETILYEYNIGNNKVIEHQFSKYYKNNYLMKLFGNKDNLSKVLMQNKFIWISCGTGLYKFDTNNKEFKHYTTKNGLPSNHLLNMVIDNNGYLWLKTNKNITRFNPKTEEFFNYYAGTDFENVNFAHCATDSIYKVDGDYIFFGLSGFVKFNPNKLNQIPPPIELTKFSLFDKEYRLDSLIHQKKQINLNYNQNFISFEFAALDYTNPKRNRYAYILEGVDKDWIYTDFKKRFAEYKNLSPGKYTFRVKASNNDGVWNEEGIFVNIYIKPPWYKTILAYIFYVILFVAFMGLIIRLNSKRLIKQKENLEKTIEERTVEIRQQNEEIHSQNEELHNQKQEIEEKNDELNQLIEEVNTQKEEITVQRDLATKQKEEIISSINYAKQIQKAVLPSDKLVQEILSEHFILFKPRDIVSGDFYWIKQIKNFTIVVAADSTGHGVPGAFMSMLGSSFLNEIVTSHRLDSTGEILNNLRTKIKKSLRQDENESKDGMDMAFYIIDKETLKLQFSGAYNPIYIIRNNKDIEDKKITESKKVKIYSDSQLFDHSIIELKADRQPLATYIIEKEFDTQRFQLQKGDCIYTFSDGYADQFGGEKNEKFRTKNFRNLLLSIVEKPMIDQHKILEKTFENWKGKLEQIDDILVMGIRI